jgi:hypothetical protein
MSAAITNLKLFSHKIFFHMNTVFYHFLRPSMPVAENLLLKRRSSSRALCFSSSSSAKWRLRSTPFRGPKKIEVGRCYIGNVGRMREKIAGWGL